MASAIASASGRLGWTTPSTTLTAPPPPPPPPASAAREPVAVSRIAASAGRQTHFIVAAIVSPLARNTKHAVYSESAGPVSPVVRGFQWEKSSRIGLYRRTV